MTSQAVCVHFEQGRTWSLDELPDRSIALDGAVRGPAFDNARQRYSFDHHDGVIRHVTLATCEQVREALMVGFLPGGFGVFINDIDGDTVLSLWLLMHPDRLRGERSARVHELVDLVGRVDALGPGRGRSHPLHAALCPSFADRQSLQMLGAMLALVDRWWETGDAPAPVVGDPATSFWLSEVGVLVRGEVMGMEGLYQVASVGVLYGPAALGSTVYTIGKRSEFVRYDVRGFLAAMNAIEPGWGGGSTIGGAPRHPGGVRSRLTRDVVEGEFMRFASAGPEAP